MPVTGYCPFYGHEEKGKTFCEAACIRYPDNLARREVIYALCAHPTAWNTCRLYQMLVHYYEREERNQ